MPVEPGLRITTARLALRPPALSDAVYIAELANDTDVAWMTTGVRHPYRLVDAEQFLARASARSAQQARTFLIDHNQFGPMGIIGLYRKADICPELGFWLGRTFRGRGFATEAVQALMKWSFEDWNVRALLAGHFADNAASARVLDKAGFLYTGEVRRLFSFGRGQEVSTRMMIWVA